MSDDLEIDPIENQAAIVRGILNLTQDVEDGLRFVHQMEVQGRIEQSQIAVEASALADLLIAKGVITAREFNERLEQTRPQQEKAEDGRVYPLLADNIDKFNVESPDLPCAELLPICHAACCNLVFSLSLQDLDERVLRWDYAFPYSIRQSPQTGKCVHFIPNQGCAVYDQRPVPCRQFDCRKDKRIWKDFEKRIPAENLAKLASVPLESD